MSSELDLSKKYTTRDGEAVTQLVRFLNLADSGHETIYGVVDGDILTWHDSGRYNSDDRDDMSEYDLIEVPLIRISLDKAYRIENGDEVVLRKWEGKDDSYTGVVLYDGTNYSDCKWDCHGKNIDSDEATKTGEWLDLVEVSDK